MANSLAACLRSVAFEMPRVHDVVPLLDVDGVVEALTARLQSTGSGGLYCPLPVSGRHMQRFLQFRLQ